MPDQSCKRFLGSILKIFDNGKSFWNLQIMSVLGLAALAATIPGLALAYEGGDIALSNPTTVDMSGHQENELHTGEPIGFSSVIENHGSEEKRFTYVVEVLDLDNQVQSSSGMSANIYPDQSLTVSESWTPQKAGTYHVQTYLLNGDLIQSPITGIIKTSITVN